MSRQFRAIGAPLRRAALITSLVAIAACSQGTRSHGFIPLPEDLSAMTVGVDTRDDIIARVGPPTTTGVVGDSTLYYVQSARERFGPFEPAIVSREVLAISFSPAGVLSNIERFGLEDGRVVTLSRRITDDGIQDVTFIGQLLGTIGQIDAGQIFDGPLGSDDGGI